MTRDIPVWPAHGDLLRGGGLLAAIPPQGTGHSRPAGANSPSAERADQRTDTRTTDAAISRPESAIGGEEPPFPRSRAVICTAWRLTCDICLHGNEAWAANSTSCAERADLCGEESGWQERGASGPGPLALGQHQRCRCVPGRAGPQAPAGVVLCCAANRPAPQRWGSCPVTVL